MITKVCSYCREEKEPSEFNKGSRFIDGLQPWCRSCQKAERELHREQYAERHANYYQNHKERLDNLNNQWAAEHPDRRKEIYTKYRKANLDKVREGSRASWSKNYDKNREKIYANVKARRAIEKGAKGTFTSAEWREMLDLFGNYCAYCWEPLAEATQDHIKPLCMGGRHEWNNIVPACRSCNSRKQKRNLLDFLEEI